MSMFASASIKVTATTETAAVFTALAIVIMVSQLFGQVLARLGQPRVMGEILGGIALGPSLLGWIAPNLEEQLFGGGIIDELSLLGQLGLAMFMYLVGLELRPSMLRGQAALALRISLSGIVVPMAMGIALAYGLNVWDTSLFPGERTLDGALFMGTAMAITAFPVLACILKERGLQEHKIGSLSIACAAIDDLFSWVILAGVVAFARSGSAIACLIPLGLTAAWAFVLLVLLRPAKRYLVKHFEHQKEISPLVQGALFAGLLISSVVTDQIGVHLIFGAFLWGLAMPRHNELQTRMETKLETVVMRLLLPMFFVASGLETELTKLGRGDLLLITALVLGVAVAGKYSGTWASARLGGVPERDAQALAWLANTRGMTELVVLNVGLKLGAINATLFGIGVVMAVATTLMTGPMLDRLGFAKSRLQTV